MQAISAWLTARPWNAVLGLSLTILAPFAPLVSGAVMALLVLAIGPQPAALAAGGAAAFLSVLLLLFGSDVVAMLGNAALVWVPAALLAYVVRQTRSLTLGIQVAAIVAMLGTIAFFAVVGDPDAFWLRQLEILAAAFAEMELTQQAQVLTTHGELLAPQMTMLFVFTSWSMWVLMVVIGNALHRVVPGRERYHGRFCDLNLGRVLALMMAVASLSVLVVGAEWLQNLAFVMFAVFWLQGMAILHWLHTDGPLPLLAVIGVYVLLPFLNVLLIMLLAVLGYTDAWFEYRPRIAAARKAK